MKDEARVGPDWNFCEKWRNRWQQGLLGGYELNCQKQSQWSQINEDLLYGYYLHRGRGVFTLKTIKALILPIIEIFFRDHWFDTEGNKWEKTFIQSSFYSNKMDWWLEELVINSQQLLQFIVPENRLQTTLPHFSTLKIKTL